MTALGDGLDFTLLDGIAVALLLVCWLGYDRIADSPRLDLANFTRAVHEARRRWMAETVLRDNRIADTQLLGHLMRNVNFFTSTTILIIGALLAAFGAAERGQTLMSELPFMARTSLPVWEMKLLLLIFVFTYAFFKLTWSVRQFNYCCILLGSAPYPDEAREACIDIGRRCGELANRAGDNFNKALRTYYFGLAALTWFIHPALFIAATLWVVAVLWWREFRSTTVRILR